MTLNLLGWNGWRITIPIFARHRNFAFFKQAKDRDDKTDNPKMIAWPKGHLKLYGREYLTSEASQIVVCEGSSTDWCWKPMVLRPSPQPLARERLKKSGQRNLNLSLRCISALITTRPGKDGALRVARLIPHAKIVELPAEVGEGGDVTVGQGCFDIPWRTSYFLIKLDF